MDANKSPVQPLPDPTIVSQPTGGGGSNKLVLWLIMGLLVIGLIGVGYLYMGGQRTGSNYQAPVTGKSTPAPESNLDNELNSIDVTASDSDFNSIDQDLGSL